VKITAFGLVIFLVAALKAYERPQSLLEHIGIVPLSTALEMQNRITSLEVDNLRLEKQKEDLKNDIDKFEKEKSIETGVLKAFELENKRLGEEVSSCENTKFNVDVKLGICQVNLESTEVERKSLELKVKNILSAENQDDLSTCYRDLETSRELFAGLEFDSKRSSDNARRRLDKFRDVSQHLEWKLSSQIDFQRFVFSREFETCKQMLAEKQEQSQDLSGGVDESAEEVFIDSDDLDPSHYIYQSPIESRLLSYVYILGWISLTLGLLFIALAVSFYLFFRDVDSAFADFNTMIPQILDENKRLRASLKKRQVSQADTSSDSSTERQM
jgi:hypothetical protein